MGIQWQQQELDKDILKMLIDFGPIRGRTFCDVFQDYKKQQVYDRLRELRRMKMLESEMFVGESDDEEQASNRVKKPKKYGKLYFLTSYGVEKAKNIVYGIEGDGSERSQKPDEREMAVYWKSSLLMSHIPLKFTPKRVFKRKYNLASNMMIDLGYRGWAITFARNTTEIHKAKLALQASIMVSAGHSKNLVVCNTRAQQSSFVKYFQQKHCPGIYVLVLNDYDTITRLLTETIINDTIQTLREEVGPVEIFDTPQEGYRYEVNGKKANIYSLVGFPIETLIRLNKKVPLPGFMALADITQYKQIARHYPKLLERYTPIIAKEFIHPPIEEEIETPEEKEAYTDWAAEINMDLLNFDVGLK